MSDLAISQRRKGLAAAFTTAGAWSLLAIILKFALKYSDSYTIVWYRMVTSFTVLLLWFLVRGQAHKMKVFLIKPGQLLIGALCLSANYVGFMQGVHYTSPANAQIFIQLGPLLLALAGIYIFKEKLSRKQMIGLVLCVFGFGLFFMDRMEKVGEDTGVFFLGLAWIIFAAVIWAVFASLQKHLLNFWDSSQINIYIYLVATIVYLPFVDWQSLIDLPLAIHALYIFLGLNTILAYGFLSIALRNLPATQVSPILIMNPLLTLVFIAIIDFMEWGFIPADPVGWAGYIGSLIAILGVVYVITQRQSKV